MAVAVCQCDLCELQLNATVYIFSNVHETIILGANAAGGWGGGVHVTARTLHTLRLGTAMQAPNDIEVHVNPAIYAPMTRKLTTVFLTLFLTATPTRTASPTKSPSTASPTTSPTEPPSESHIIENFLAIPRRVNHYH